VFALPDRGRLVAVESRYPPSSPPVLRRPLDELGRPIRLWDSNGFTVDSLEDGRMVTLACSGRVGRALSSKSDSLFEVRDIVERLEGDGRIGAGGIVSGRSRPIIPSRAGIGGTGDCDPNEERFACAYGVDPGPVDLFSPTNPDE
jgi:hypothetical protein